jgi:hypothetical protein
MWSWITHSLRRELCFWMSIHYVFRSSDQFTSLQLTSASNHLQPCKDFQWVQNVLMHGLLQRNISTSSSHICQSKMKCCCGSSETFYSPTTDTCTFLWQQIHNNTKIRSSMNHSETRRNPVCITGISHKRICSAVSWFCFWWLRTHYITDIWLNGQNLNCIVRTETFWESFSSKITKLVR